MPYAKRRMSMKYRRCLKLASSNHHVPAIIRRSSWLRRKTVRTDSASTLGVWMQSPDLIQNRWVTRGHHDNVVRGPILHQNRFSKRLLANTGRGGVQANYVIFNPPRIIPVLDDAVWSRQLRGNLQQDDEKAPQKLRRCRKLRGWYTVSHHILGQSSSDAAECFHQDATSWTDRETKSVTSDTRRSTSQDT